jgi:hypothetical protein
LTCASFVIDLLKSGKSSPLFYQPNLSLDMEGRVQ